MAGGDDLCRTPFGLRFKQIDQKPEPGRVDAIVYLLEEVEPRGIVRKQRCQHCQETQGAVRHAVSRHLVATGFDNGELHQPRHGIDRKPSSPRHQSE